ncbi:MAG: efflux RND transporter periplasmic adaptor subunit [Paracoccaceae bacterium]
MRSVLPAPLAEWLADEESDEEEESAVPVRLAPVETGTARDRFETSGEVVAADSVALSAEVAARVERVFVEDGAELVAGQPILRFDTSAQRSALEAAKAAAAEAEAELARQRTLLERDVVAEARVETARAAAERARAEVAAAERRLDDRTVRAPFGGRVGFVDVSPGAVLSPGDPIAALRTIDDLRVRFALPQALAERAADTGEAALRGEGRSEDCGRARILLVSPLADPESRTRTLEAKLPDSCSFAPGAFLEVAVTVARRDDAVFVPQSAVTREGFDSWAWRAEEGEDDLVARRTPLELGVLDGDRYEVRSGLSEGDRVIVSGLQKVSDGARIRPLEDDDDGGGEGGDGETGDGESGETGENGAASSEEDGG